MLPMNGQFVKPPILCTVNALALVVAALAAVISAKALFVAKWLLLHGCFYS
jgi:hypothetical protein